MPSSDVFYQAAVFACASFGLAVLGYAVLDRDPRARQRMLARLRAVDPNGPARAGRHRASHVTRAVQRLGEAIAPRDKARSNDLRRQLVHAGYYHQSSVLLFYGIRLLSVVGGAGAVGAGCWAAGFDWHKCLLWVGSGALAGFLVPSMALDSQVKGRRRLLQKAIPDALDIIVMCVESGASLNAAIDWVTDEIQAVHPALATELGIVRREMQLGLTAGDGFRHFADRSGVEDIRDLAATICQSELHGASVGKALRSYADAARLERQMWAEEMSQKAAVKIVFPTLLCIFPAMFTVLLGPAAFQMAKLFSR